MPIYAYKCDTCGYAKDILQKMSDPLLTECPSCNKATFKKQLTAAGFQLKGTGWYVTDFREGGGKNNAPAVEAKSDAAESVVTSPAATSATPANTPTTTPSSTTASTSTAASTPTPTPSSAAAPGA
jgi:putative FmdB family regulatory protein